MLAIGRALMSRPQLLLLDEPSLGFSPVLVKEIFKIIRTINERGRDHFAGGTKCPDGPGVSNMGLIIENGRFVMKGESKRADGRQGCQGILHGHPVRSIGQGISALETKEGMEIIRSAGQARPPVSPVKTMDASTSLVDRQTG